MKTWTTPHLSPADRRTLALALILAGDYLPELAEPANRAEPAEPERKPKPTGPALLGLGRGAMP